MKDRGRVLFTAWFTKQATWNVFMSLNVNVDVNLNKGAEWSSSHYLWWYAQLFLTWNNLLNIPESLVPQAILQYGAISVLYNVYIRHDWVECYRVYVSKCQDFWWFYWEQWIFGQ